MKTENEHKGIRITWKTCWTVLCVVVSLLHTSYYIQHEFSEVTLEEWGFRDDEEIRQMLISIHPSTAIKIPINLYLVCYLLYFFIDWKRKEMGPMCVRLISIFKFYTCLLSVKFAQQGSSKSPKQQHRNLQWVKIENRVKNWILGRQWTTSTAVQEQR